MELDIFDKYCFGKLFDLSERVSRYSWKDDDFLVFGENKEIGHTIPPEVLEQADKGISELLGIPISGRGTRWYRTQNPMDGIIYDCYRIEARKEFIGELEKAKQTLEEMLDRPHNKRMEKDIRHRARQLQKRIDAHKLGCEHAFLIEKEVKKFMHQHNTHLRVFEYTTIIPLMEVGNKYEAALDVLEKAGVPNVHTHREFGKRTKKAFFDNWRKGHFVPYASVYLVTHREEALEDIVRRLPGVKYPGEIHGASNPDLKPLVSDEKFQKKIMELGLPLEETTRLIAYIGEYRDSFGSLKPQFLKAARGFYRKQLEHDDISLRWIAARALADSYHLPELWYFDMPTKWDKMRWKKDQMKEYAAFNKEEMKRIISVLNIDKKYPLLAESPALLAERFLEYKGEISNWKDPYDLETLEKLLPITRKANRLLKPFGISLNLADFCNYDNLETVANAVGWIADNMGPERYAAVYSNPYFRRLISREFNIAKHPRMARLMDSIRDVSIELERYAAKIGDKKFREIYDCLFERIGFDEDELAVCDFYAGFLGRSFDNLMKDFEEVGKPLTRLPGLKEFYSRFFDEGKVKAILNYVAKKRSRDMIEGLPREGFPERLLYMLAEKVEEKAGKRDIIKALIELKKTKSLLETLKIPDCDSMISERLSELSSPTIDKLLSTIIGIREGVHSDVVGNAEVPESMREMVDNIVIAFHKQSGRYYGVDVQPPLKLIATTYLAEGPKRAFEAIRELDQNMQLRQRLIGSGVNMDVYETGIRKTYHLKTDDNQEERIKERIGSEMGQIYNRLRQLDVSGGVISELKEGSIAEQLGKIEKLLGNHQFNEMDKGLKPEIKGHINAARSISGTMKEIEDDVEFYVSTDPFEALHMGQYFNSCLSLSENTNGWASVVQVMDCNKNVIYARGSNGNYVGRNRTALTDKGILCTRFYQNGNLFIEDAWVDYLTQFGKEVSEDILIPVRFAHGAMAAILDRKMAQGEVLKERRTAYIEPAYFSEFYNDGIGAMKLEDGRIEVQGNFYIIKAPQKEKKEVMMGQEMTSDQKIICRRLMSLL